MWDLVSFTASLVVFMVLISLTMSLAMHGFDIPEWITQTMKGRKARSELEGRIQALETRVAELESKA